MENGRDGLVLPMSLAPNLRQKRNGITSTVWSPWKWVKNTRFTLDGPWLLVHSAGLEKPLRFIAED